jgi:predicted DsbA family dithiol-disulfide isomerase
MVAPMEVEIWSDVVCPWCYIGKRRFEQALERWPDRDDITVTYRAFQLDPSAPPGAATPVAEVYRQKFGGAENAARIMEHVTSVAEESGLTFHLDRAVRANTLMAHRLLWLARERRAQGAVKERLLAAYFVEGRNIGDPDVLVELAVSVGLGAGEVEAFLASDAGRDEVLADLSFAADNGITAVPTYVFGGRWTVPGAQEPDTFLRVLERVASLEAAGND